MPTIRKNTTKQVASFYWHSASAYPARVAAVLLTLPFAILCNNILPPLILANVLQRLSRGDYIAGQPWQSFGSDITFYAVFVILSGGLAWRVVDFFGWVLESNVQRDMARKVFDHLAGQSADFHANHFSGSLVSQTNKLLGSYVRMADTTIYMAYPLLITLVASSVILVSQAPLYVLCLDIFAIFYVVTSLMVSRPVRERGAEHAAAESKQTGYLADVIGNIMAVKSFAGERFENNEFAKVTDHTRSKLLGLMRASQKQFAYFGTVTGTISAVSFALAVISVVSFGAQIGTVFLIFNYTANIAALLFQFSNNGLKNYNRSVGDASDMVAILNTPPEIIDPTKPEEQRMNRGTIHFKDVTFTHKGANKPIFQKLSLKIKPGEKVGLVGHSGSGKTSLTRILLRFSDIDSGAIEIDGQNIAKVTQADLRRAISYVPQEPILFHRTIAENIAYGRAEPTQQEVEVIARKANADEFIQGLPKKYQTIVGERGVKLSGGQRQRIAIARAMLKNAPILVLDEATSALDSESEALIQDALWKLMEGRTAIVIAHRLSTIQRMDRIVVLDDGKIVEEGSHKDLLFKKGVYAKLWERQSGGFIDE